jgi:hypothetical protein
MFYVARKLRRAMVFVSAVTCARIAGPLYGIMMEEDWTQDGLDDLKGVHHPLLRRRTL